MIFLPFLLFFLVPPVPWFVFALFEEKITTEQEEQDGTRKDSSYPIAGVLRATSRVCSARNRSASMAAMQPVPAAVTAWR